MKSKTTGIWFLIAASLFAFIWFFQKYLQPAAPAVEHLFPGLRASDVTAMEINPAGEREIIVVHTNDGWLLEKPLNYPAQTAAIQSLASALEKQTVATRITAAEMQGRKDAEAGFGFDKPQFTLVVEAGSHRQHLIIGNKTAPGDQVFIRRVGEPGALVVDAGWLQLMPRTATDWRDRALMAAAGNCDWIIITNGSKVMEFRFDAPGQTWRMVRPLQARADGSRIATALQQLRAGRVTQFITDDPPADLSGYGLQPAELDIWTGRGTNLTAGVQAGKSLPDKPSELYARREGWNSVLAVDKEVFTPWRGEVNDFRDTHLLSPLPPVTEIEIRGEKSFTLQQAGSNTWTVAGEKFPADADNVQAFLKVLANLRVADTSGFVKDVVTTADLQSFGLDAASRKIILRGKTGDTNAVFCELMFGLTDTNRVFVKRADEDFVYAINVGEFNNLVALYGESWEFRDRRIWNFSETNVVQVTLQQGGKTRQIVRTGEDKWSLAPGSQGMINPPAVEETMHRLGDLSAYYWIGRDIVSPEKFGLGQGNLAITIELKSGDKLAVEFGTEIPKAHTALAAVTLQGERWVFVFPPTLYQFVATYLTIPPNIP